MGWDSICIRCLKSKNIMVRFFNIVRVFNLPPARTRVPANIPTQYGPPQKGVPLVQLQCSCRIGSSKCFSRPKSQCLLKVKVPRYRAALRASLPRGTGRSLFMRRAVASLSLLLSLALFLRFLRRLCPRNRHGAIPANKRKATFDPSLWVVGWSLSSARGQVCSCSRSKRTKKGGHLNVNNPNRRQYPVLSV